LCGASGAGASPGDGVFDPVSPVYLLTRPNRMTVSPGTRAGRVELAERRIGDVAGSSSTSSARTDSRSLRVPGHHPIG
jgi:hypothetical protein